MQLESYSWAEIGGVRLHGAPPDSSKPFRGLMLSSLTGWRGLPAARGGSDSIPGAHGTFQGSNVLRAERSMLLRGAAITDSAGETAELLAVLESATAGRLVSLRVADDTGVWARQVRVENMTPAVQWNRQRVVFDLDLVAPDPVRYSDVLTVGPVGLPSQIGGLFLSATLPWDLGVSVQAIAEVVNAGELPLYPRLILSGSADSVEVKVGPRTLSFGAFAGELVFDCRDRRAFLNGGDVTRGLILRNWAAVPAGETWGAHFSAVNGSADISLQAEYQIGVW